MVGYELMPAGNAFQENDRGKRRGSFFSRLAMLVALMVGFISLSPQARAVDDKPLSKPKWAIDDTRWMTLGMGFRGTGLWVENRATGNFRNDFSIDNARVYF